MQTPPTVKNDEQLCFVTVVFPLTDDSEILIMKGNIDTAVKNFKQVKVELRVTEVRNGGLDRQG